MLVVETFTVARRVPSTSARPEEVVVALDRAYVCAEHASSLGTWLLIKYRPCTCRVMSLAEVHKQDPTLRMQGTLRLRLSFLSRLPTTVRRWQRAFGISRLSCTYRHET